MPLYRRSTSGGGSGTAFGAVTLITPIGGATVFNPDDDTDVARGAALVLAAAAAIAGDMIRVSIGAFVHATPFTFADGVHVRGMGEFLTSLACSADLPAIQYTALTAGSLMLSDMGVGGIEAVDGVVIAQGVRFDSRDLTTPISAVSLDDATMQASDCRFLSPGVTDSVTSNVAATEVQFWGCVGNNALNANVLPVPESGFTIDPDFA
jgi:hypothetical protein